MPPSPSSSTISYLPPAMVLPTIAPPSCSMVGSDPTLARFHKEMLVTAKVEHPNTIRVYDFGEADGQLYLTMEYLAGSSLRQVIDAVGRLEIKRIVRIGKQVANACL